MKWKVYGFLKSKLGEEVVATEINGLPTAYVASHPDVRGVPSTWGGDLYPYAIAEVQYNSYIGDYEWVVMYYPQFLTEKEINYLVEECNFKRDWLNPYYAELHSLANAYTPASDYVGKRMTYGFTVSTQVTNSLIVTGSGAECTNEKCNVANKAWWRNAHFGYVLPRMTGFEFTLENAKVDVENLGPDPYAHEYSLCPPFGDLPGRNTLDGAGILKYSSSVSSPYYYYPNGSGGWTANPMTEYDRGGYYFHPRTVELPGGRTLWYYFDYGNIYACRWGIAQDLTLRFKIKENEDKVKNEPQVILDAHGFRINNVRPPRRFTVSMDFAAMAAANAFSATDADIEEAYNAIISDAPSLAQMGFSLNIFKNYARREDLGGEYYNGNGFATIPDLVESVTHRIGCYLEELQRIAVLQDFILNEETEVYSYGTQCAFKIAITPAECSWANPKKFYLQFARHMTNFYTDIGPYFDAKNGQRMPTGEMAAVDFIEEYSGGMSAENEGSFSKVIVVDTTATRYDSPGEGIVERTLEYSWKITS